MLDLSPHAETIRRDFDLARGTGVTVLKGGDFFAAHEKRRIFETFPENLNWLRRDGQRLHLPADQEQIAGRLFAFADAVRRLLQDNIPERDHIRLRLDTLRVARSDGTQYQVGSRIWHQDHDSYFTAGVNLNQDSGAAGIGTSYIPLVPGARHVFDAAGFPRAPVESEARLVPPPLAAIWNGGVRHFLFPEDRARGIIHRGPTLAQLDGRRRLALLMTISVCGLDQGMDLQDVYLPLLPRSPRGARRAAALEKLGAEWRTKLGIEASLHAGHRARAWEAGLRLYDAQSLGLSCAQPVPGRRRKLSAVIPGRYRLVAFPETAFRTAGGTSPMGDLARTLHFLDHLRRSARDMATEPAFAAHMAALTDGDAQFELMALLREPTAPFQNIPEDALEDLLIATVLVGREDGRARILASHSTEFDNHPLGAFLLARALEQAQVRGARTISLRGAGAPMKTGDTAWRTLARKLDRACVRARIDGEFPLFTPRIGVDRKMPGGRISPHVSSLSRRILARRP